MHCPNPRRLAALSLLLALGASAAQAQSSYTLQVLKPPPRGWIVSPGATTDGTVWGIDASDRVVSSVTDVNRYVWKSLGFTPEYGDFAYRWPASTSSSVSGSRLYAQPASLKGVSPHGQRIAIFSGNRMLVDTATGKSVGSFPVAFNANLAMNNAGLLVGATLAPAAEFQSTGASFLAATSANGAALQLLRASGFGSTFAWAVNASGVVGGAVQERAEPRLHAALWVGGQVQLVPEAAGQASAVVALNDKGQALIRRAPVRACGVRPEASWVECDLGVETVVLRDGGTESALLGAGDTRRLGRMWLNNAGVVVGRIQQGAAPLGNGPLVPLTNHGVSGAEVPRTFIWQKGSLSDLTAWVATKGAKLPAGAVLTEVLAINDKGSLVAMMRANGADSYVRLTAKP
jgi:hypothetical protein